MDDLTSRFLDAFTTIEKHLRNMLDANKHATFNELVEMVVGQVNCDRVQNLGARETDWMTPGGEIR